MKGRVSPAPVIGRPDGAVVQSAARSPRGLRAPSRRTRYGLVMEARLKRVARAPSPCLQYRHSPEVNLEGEDALSGRVHDAKHQRSQTINVIGPGDQARGGRSYIIDVLTSYYMRPVRGARVNYDIGAC